MEKDRSSLRQGFPRNSGPIVSADRAQTKKQVLMFRFLMQFEWRLSGRRCCAREPDARTRFVYGEVRGISREGAGASHSPCKRPVKKPNIGGGRQLWREQYWPAPGAPALIFRGLIGEGMTREKR